MNDLATYKTPGCYSPSTCMLPSTASMKIPFPLLSLKNESFLHFRLSAVAMVASRSFSSLRGKWIDYPSEHKDEIYPIPELSNEELNQDYIT